jgi:tetratricopeptide (TPR) repeat protein
MIERYRKLLADFPNIPKNTAANANYWIGWGLYKENELEDVAPYLEKARELAPEYYTEPVGNILVLTAFSQRDHDALHEAIQRIHRDAPDKQIPSHILSWLGVQLFHEGDVENAVTYLESATDPESPSKTTPGVWRTLAKAQNESKKFAEALKTGKIILDLKQEKRWKADGMLDLALSYIGLGKYDEAIKTANDALALDIMGPHLAGLHLVKAEVALRQNRPEQALKDYDQTIKMVLDDPLIKPRALAGAAQAAELSGENSKAAAYRSQLKNTFPNWKEAPIEIAPQKTEGN